MGNWCAKLDALEPLCKHLAKDCLALCILLSAYAMKVSWRTNNPNALLAATDCYIGIGSGPMLLRISLIPKEDIRKLTT